MRGYRGSYPYSTYVGTWHLAPGTTPGKPYHREHRGGNISRPGGLSYPDPKKKKNL